MSCKGKFLIFLSNKFIRETNSFRETNYNTDRSPLIHLWNTKNTLIYLCIKRKNKKKELKKTNVL